MINEDGVIAIGNNVGSGDVAGVGVGPDGEPGVDKKNKKKVLPFKEFIRRKNDSNIKKIN